MLTNYSENNNDQLLWEKFLNGDDKAYACFYKQNIEQLFSYGMQFTSNRELVKDCIQDVFIKLYSNRSTRNKIKNIKVYLFMALKNTLFTIFQKDKPSYHIDTIEPVFSIEYSIEDRLIANELEQERKIKMKKILDSLTPRQKEVIYYRYVEGMTLEQICKLMDMNYQSVQNLIQRSINKVRNTLKEKDKSIKNIKFFLRCL